jgi:hypothetical protein
MLIISKRSFRFCHYICLLKLRADYINSLSCHLLWLIFAHLLSFNFESTFFEQFNCFIDKGPKRIHDIIDIKFIEFFDNLFMGETAGAAFWIPIPVICIVNRSMRRSIENMKYVFEG